MRTALAALASVAVLIGAGCAGTAEEANAERVASKLSLPEQLVGLKVKPEKVGSGLKRVERPYVDSVAVFSLREKDLLRASLQINRFNTAARPKDSGFRQSIIATIGGTAPLTLRVDEEQVYATLASDQSIFTWFDGDGMFVLAIQKEFAFPRTLLRRVVDLDLSL